MRGSVHAGFEHIRCPLPVRERHSANPSDTGRDRGGYDTSHDTKFQGDYRGQGASIKRGGVLSGYPFRNFLSYAEIFLNFFNFFSGLGEILTTIADGYQM